MKLITWNKKLSIGVKEIDNQHKNFISLINKTYSLKGLNNTKKISEILNELIEYARIHFSTEENYFKQWNYPYAADHMVEHEKLILKTLQFNQRFEKEGSKILKEFVNFLKDWIETHLKKYDFKYRDYIKSKGII